MDMICGKCNHAFTVDGELFCDAYDIEVDGSDNASECDYFEGEE